MSPQELMISKKMARLNVQLAKKRKQTLEKTDAQDTDTTKTDTKESFEIDEASRIPTTVSYTHLTLPTLYSV